MFFVSISLSRKYLYSEFLTPIVLLESDLVVLTATATATEITQDPKVVEEEVPADCDCEKDEDQRMWEETEKRLKDRMDCLERSRLSIEKGGEAEWCP